MAESIKELAGKGLALFILLLAAFLLFKVVLGILTGLAWTFLGVAVLVAAIWALSRLLQVEYFVFFFFCGLSAGTIGRIKGSSFFIWFLVGFCLPLLGTILALLWRWEKDEPMRRCEECGAVLPVYDQVCMNCGKDLEFPGEVFRLSR